MTGLGLTVLLIVSALAGRWFHVLISSTKESHLARQHVHVRTTPHK